MSSNKQDQEENVFTGHQDSSSPEPVEQMVLSELVEIRDKLKVQLLCVAERERALREREDRMRQLEILMANTQDQLAHCIQQEVDRRLKECHYEVGKLEETVQLREKENQRLRNSFEAVKLANKNLKVKLDEMMVQNGRQESQLTNMQGRLRSLQRKIEYSDKAKVAPGLQQTTKVTVSTQTPSWSQQGGTGITSQLLSLLMSTVTEVLSNPSPRQQVNTVAEVPVKRLLQLSGQLLPTLDSSVEGPFVQFLYTVLTHTSKKERSHLKSTLRRIFEQLYQPFMPRFYKSSDVVVRTFSILVILITTTQVDVVCEVLQQLKDILLENSQCRDLFLNNCGVEQLIQITQPVNKVITGLVMDTFLQLSIESSLLPRFLKACASEEWFSMTVHILSQHTSVGIHTLEKLSILLQRLSKIKNFRQYFEGCKMSLLLQKILATDGLQAQAPFLALNLQSTLMNLTCS